MQPLIIPIYIPLLSDYPMILTLLGLTIGGLLTFLVGRKSERGAFALATLSMLGGLFLNILMLIQVYSGLDITHSIVWLGSPTDPLMTLGFLGDGFSTPIALLILGLGFLSILFSSVYMSDLKHPGLYYALMVWFVGSMVGVIYATNLLQFFLFYELMLIPAFVLVYLYGVSEDAQTRSRNAVRFWVWTALGGIIWIFGAFMLYGMTGTLEMGELYTATLALDTARIIGVVFLLGFGIKLGLFPLHIWAPSTYREAPIPVLVLLSGAMTKTAAYGVIRIVIPIFSDALRTLSTGLILISLITMYYGAMNAIAQKDLKMMLAYSSISQLGYLMFGYSSMTLTGVSGAAFQLANHGILASLMFFCAGAIEMKTGTMKFERLGGLAPKMPALATIYVIGSLALAGAPPLSGFAGEWLIFGGVAERAVAGTFGQMFYLVLTLLGVVATGLTAGYYLWAIRRVFFGPVSEDNMDVTDPPRLILIIGGLLILFVVGLGIYPQILWHIVNPVLTLLLGGGG
jgi:NADH-quinone oxidoreductase subunit M